MEALANDLTFVYGFNKPFSTCAKLEIETLCLRLAMRNLLAESLIY